MRMTAQVIGWIWLAWTTYAILGTIVIYLIPIPGITYGGGIGPKLFAILMQHVLLAIPGVLLVLWGRRGKKEQAG